MIVGDGNYLKICHTRDTSVKSTYGSVQLCDVLVVPSIKKKILSVSQLAKDESCVFEFSDSNIKAMERKTGKILTTGSRKGNLCAIDGNITAALMAIKIGKASEDIWHQRLRHLNSKFLKIFYSKSNVSVCI